VQVYRETSCGQEVMLATRGVGDLRGAVLLVVADRLWLSGVRWRNSCPSRVPTGGHAAAVTVPVGQRELAARTSLSLRSVNRAMRERRARRLVGTAGRAQITVIDVDGLRNMAVR